MSLLINDQHEKLHLWKLKTQPRSVHFRINGQYLNRL